MTIALALQDMTNSTGNKRRSICDSFGSTFKGADTQIALRPERHRLE
jgi:hypothetical protein